MPTLNSLAELETAVSVFDFMGQRLRVITKGGEPWFVASDVCDALSVANSRDAVSRLDDDERGVATTDTLGGEQEVVIISESGLYSLILTSRKLEAKRFKKWVTSEVLPSIRKTGGYKKSPTPDIPLLPYTVEFNSFLVVAGLMGVPQSLAMSEATKRVRLTHDVDLSNLLAMSPTQDNIEAQDVCLEPTEIAKKLGLSSAIALNRMLSAVGLQEPAVDPESLTDWVPVGEARGHAFTHQWAKGTKSGYNLKWHLNFVRDKLGHLLPKG